MAIWNFKTPKFVYDLSELNKIEDDFEAIRLAMLSGLQIECVNRMKKMNKEKLKDILSQVNLTLIKTILFSIIILFIFRNILLRARN